MAASTAFLLLSLCAVIGLPLMKSWVALKNLSACAYAQDSCDLPGGSSAISLFSLRYGGMSFFVVLGCGLGEWDCETVLGVADPHGVTGMLALF